MDFYPEDKDMSENTNGAAVAVRTDKNKQVPFSKDQEKELKWHKIIIAAEVVIILVLVILRWFVGGWWITWDTSWGDDESKGQEASEGTQETVYSDFVAPEFDPNAVEGVPEVDASLGWAVLNIAQGYDVHVCGVLNADADGSLPVWFSSESTNTVWVKLRVLDEDGNILGETGILKPGEYVERIQLAEGTHSCAVTLQVMGYEPETYYSAGSVGLATTLVVAN